MTGPVERLQTTCPTCARSVPQGAPWCGGCGERLARPDPPIVPLTTPGTEPPADARYDELPSSDVPDSDEADAGEARAARRAWPRRRVIVVGLAVLALVATATVVLRPAPLGLHELATVGAGDAGGRDAARTGRTGLPPLADPGATLTWRSDPPADANDPWRWWPDLLGDVVALHGPASTRVFDRATGEPLWESEGGWLQSARGMVLSADEDRVVGLDPRSGEERWQWVAGAGEVVDVLGVLDDQVLLGASGPDREGATRATLVDVGTGQVRWTVEVAEGASWLGSWNEDWLHLGGRWRQDGTVGPGALVGRADGKIRPAPVAVAVSEFDPPSVVLLEGDRALVGGLQAQEVDVRTGEVLARHAELDGSWLQAAADVVVAQQEGAVSVLDRISLAPLWGVAQGWVDVRALQLDPTRTEALVQDGQRGRVVDVRTGRSVVDDFAIDNDHPTVADELGIVRVVDALVSYRSHDGGVSWDLGAEGGGLLRAVGEHVHLETELGVYVHDVADGARSDRRTERFATPLVAGDHRGIFEASGTNLRALGKGTARVIWSKPVPQQVVAMMLAEEALHLATPEILLRVDPATGDVLAQRGVQGTRSISVAGGREDGVLVLLRDDSCHPGGSCRSVAQRHDPTTLDEVWTSEPVDGVCAGATLAEDRVAIPTTGGMAFLEAGTGRLVETWDVPGASCLDAAYDNGQWILVAGDALAVGRPGAPPTLVDAGHDLTSAPLLRQGQVVATTPDGVVAVSLDGVAPSWFHELPLAPVAGPVVAGDGVVVALVDRSLVRLG